MELTSYASTLLSRLEKPTAKSKRDEALQNFMGHGITVKKGKKYVLADKRDLHFVLLHIPTEDLDAFHKQCLKARSYSKFFGWSIKPQKV